MSDKSIAEYRDQVVSVAVRQGAYSIAFERARDYIASLKATGEFQRNRHYIVVAERDGTITGYIWAPRSRDNELRTRSRMLIAEGKLVCAVTGADVEVCGLYK